MQHSPDLTEYDDQIGVQYHYPSQYFDRVAEGERFIYCRPQEGTTDAEKRKKSGTVYFGTGTIGTLRQDLTKEGHKYCQIEDYFDFLNEVPYRTENGIYLETGTKQIPVMRSAVRVITSEAFDRIIEYSGLNQTPSDIYQRLQSIRNRDRQLAELDEAYKSATPKVKQYLTKRIERGAAIGGRIKELNKYVCQICNYTPFITRTGQPYAEAHHIVPLHRLEPGSNSSQNVICVCANCHRRMHYGNVETISADDASITFIVDGMQKTVKRNVLS
jgi:5-methylcytosine-specific restriction endonuclease McrA